MSKVITICGKICCGKTYYSNMIKQKNNAVIMSCDELTSIIFNNQLGDRHDEMMIKVKYYLLQKTLEIVNAGTDVILDWGFWSKADRQYIKDYFKAKNIDVIMHYIDITDNTWSKNIMERNNRILNGEDKSNYYLDDGLINKLQSLWETPSKDEIDVWYKLDR